jgi:hypothetical protein
VLLRGLTDWQVLEAQSEVLQTSYARRLNGLLPRSCLTRLFFDVRGPHETRDGTVFQEIYWSAVHTPVMGADRKVAFVAQNAIGVTDLYDFDKTAQVAQVGKNWLAQQAPRISTTLRCMKQ